MQTRKYDNYLGVEGQVYVRMIGKKPKKNLKRQNLKDEHERHSIPIVCECQLQAADLQFNRKNWSEAVIRYSQCIDEANDQLDEVYKAEETGRHGIGGWPWIGGWGEIFDLIATAIYITDARVHCIVRQGKLKRNLLVAYSSRAEARLHLEDYQNALLDSDKALEIYPHVHDYQTSMSDAVKALELEYYPDVKGYLNGLLDYNPAGCFYPQLVENFIRKGKAARGLHLFEEACKAFKEASEESPNDQSIWENLQACTEAFTRSKYDLSEFFLKGCKGEAPSCADFVGPVEVKYSFYRGYRMLYAERNVNAGELLLVSNPLAVVVKDADWEKNLIAEVTDRIRTSGRKMTQLYSLITRGDKRDPIEKVMGGCSVLRDLFGPDSEEFPPRAENDLQIGMDLICRVVRKEALCRDNHTLWARTCDQNETEFVGLWVLPRYARHSCAPNVFLTWIGDALFLRASENIGKNDYLTVSFIQERHLFLSSVFRSGEIFWSLSFETWMKWNCHCDRCQFEDIRQYPRATLARIRKDIPKLMAAAKSERLEEGKVWGATKELAEVAEEVEREVIQIHPRSPKMQGWIRSYFLDAYIAKLQLAMDESDSLPRMKLLGLIVDTITSVYVTPRALKLAANLLWETRRMYSKDSDAYVLTLNRVLSIYRVAFGNEPDSVLLKLIKVNRLKDLKDFLLDYKAG